VIAGLGLALSGCQLAETRQDAAENSSIAGVRAPRPSDVYVELAVAYLQQGQTAVALSKIQQALDADRDNADAHNVAALVQQRLGDSAQAEAEFKAALSLAPGHFYAHNAYGVFLCGQKRYAEADEQFQAATQNPLNTVPWVARTNAGICLEEQGDAAGAERAYREALQANPRFAPALLRMARATLAGSDYQSARGYVQRYLSAAEPTAEILLIGVQAERGLGDKETAKKFEKLLRARFPDSPEVQRLREL
jgi:type IV pilus assembly protein PilF